MRATQDARPVRETRWGLSWGSWARDAGDGDADRRQAEQDDEQWQLGDNHAGEREGSKQECSLTAAIWHQQPDPGRDHQARGRRGKPAEDIPEDRNLSEVEVEAAKRQADCPRYQNET